MGGNINALQYVVETTGYTLDRPYDHVNVTYDSSDRVTNADYWQDAGETMLKENFTITYSGAGYPIENGTELINHVFDIYRGRFIVDTSPSMDANVTSTMIIHGCMEETFMYVDFDLFSNTSNSSIIWPTSAELITVVSTSSLDSAAGVGIRTILMTGTHGTGAEISETIIMTGLTPVVSSLSYKRINSLISVTSGADNEAKGIITFTNASLQLLDSISIGNTRSTSIKYSVPTGKAFALSTFCVNVDFFGEYEVKLIKWERNPDVPPYTIFHSMAFSGQHITHTFQTGIDLTAGTDIAAIIRKRSGTNGNSIITGQLVGLLSTV
jgi:hypothetical protein